MVNLPQQPQSYLIWMMKIWPWHWIQAQPHRLDVSDACLVSLWMPARRQPYQRGALYLLKEDQWGSHRHARALSFIGWLLWGLSFIGWLLRQAYLYWLAPPEDSLWAVQGWGGAWGGGCTARTTGPGTDSSITSVGKHATLFPPSGQRDSHCCVSSLPFLPTSSSASDCSDCSLSSFSRTTVWHFSSYCSVIPEPQTWEDS